MHDKHDCDLELPWLLMGYRFSRQESTKLSPYYMLYGREPVLPMGAAKELVAPLPDELIRLGESGKVASISFPFSDADCFG